MPPSKPRMAAAKANAATMNVSWAKGKAYSEQSRSMHKIKTQGSSADGKLHPSIHVCLTYPLTRFLRSCMASSLLANSFRFLPVPIVAGSLKKFATVDAADCVYCVQ
eukprot:scaffold230362_cov20-Tisochrysis_lutea.AAC.1